MQCKRLVILLCKEFPINLILIRQEFNIDCSFDNRWTF